MKYSVKVLAITHPSFPSSHPFSTREKKFIFKPWKKYIRAKPLSDLRKKIIHTKIVFISFCFRAKIYSDGVDMPRNLNAVIVCG
jgi:hypothetical protein